MDDFKEYPVTLTTPAVAAAAVVPNDTMPLTAICRAIYVGQTGDVSVEMQSGQIALFENVQAGSILAVRLIKVRQTGTTATGIMALT